MGHLRTTLRSKTLTQTLSPQGGEVPVLFRQTRRAERRDFSLDSRGVLAELRGREARHRKVRARRAELCDLRARLLVPAGLLVDDREVGKAEARASFADRL